MKKILLFIIILISSAYAYSQTNFPDLAEKTTSSGAYEFAIYTGGAGYRMSVSTLQTDLYDSIADHRTELGTLDTTDYFSRTGSLITLKDAGDDIRLGANEVLQFYDANNYIYSISSGSWIMVSGGSLTQVFGSDISIYKHFIPNTTNTIDLGSSSKFYRNSFIDTTFIEDVNTWILKDGSNNMVLRDAVTGAKTLAVLAAPSDSITTHRGELDNLADSIDNHRDTLTDHNTRMLALESSVVSTDSAWESASADTLFTNSGNAVSAYVLLKDENAALKVFNEGDELSIEITSTTMVVTDAQSTKGLINAADYSANTTARSLIDSAQAASMISGSVNSFENGLTEAANVVKLGGDLTGDTYVTGTGNTADIFFRHIETGTNSSWIAMQGDAPIDMVVFENDDYTGNQSGIHIGEGYIYIDGGSSASAKSFDIADASMLITDAEDTKGLEYAADYSANYTARSIPDSAHVADMIETNELLTINAQTGTTYTLVLTDRDKLITLTNAAADTLIVPPNASVAFPIGTQITITQLGAGQVLVEEGAAVTVSSAGSHLKLRVQYSSATLIKIDTNTWLLVGDIAS